MGVIGEAVFFDVGQGAANAIVLRNGVALIFDVGPRNHGVLHEYIQARGVDSIGCVILSHNDRDHICGWENFARRYGKKIERIFVLEDRDHSRDSMWDDTVRLVSAGVIPNPLRAEVPTLGKSVVAWRCNKTNCKVRIVYPDMLSNVEAKRDKSPNSSSVIAVFEWEGGRIVFPGDSTISSWRKLVHVSGPIVAEVLAMPHHGGLLCSDDALEVKWLLTTAVNARNVVISVGTNNQYGHPHVQTISAIRDAGGSVLCTQLTSRCCNPNMQPERDRDTMSSVYHLSASHSEPQGRSGVPCFGTVIADLNDNGAVIRGRGTHLKFIEKCVSNPLCASSDTTS